MITPVMKYVKLYYANNAGDDYYQVFCCHKLEMRHRDLKDIAEELVARTNSPEWRMQLRRAIAPGDIFTVDNEIYTFEPGLPAPDNIQTYELDKWKHLAVTPASDRLSN